MYVFVYGTLKRNFPNHHNLINPENGKATFVSEGKTVDLFPLVTATEKLIPFLLDKKGTGKHVQGEVYEVDEQMLKFLDVIERNPTMYKRNEVEIQLVPSGEVISAGAFFFHSFLSHFLEGQLWDNYTCENFDAIQSVSKKRDPDFRRKSLILMRGEKYYENRGTGE